MALLREGRVKRMAGSFQQFEVESGANVYHVDLNESPECHCGDNVWREVACKHALAVLLSQSDERLVHAVADGLGFPPVEAGQ